MIFILFIYTNRVKCLQKVTKYFFGGNKFQAVFFTVAVFLLKWMPPAYKNSPNITT